MRSLKQHMLLVFTTLFVVIGLDQVTKVMARAWLIGKGTIRVVGDFFVLQYAENTGSFLGMFGQMGAPWRQILLIGLPAIIIGVFSWYIIKHRELSIFYTILYSSMLAGGIGNFYDRVVFNGSVTDFLNVGIGSLRTGIFNIADMPITFGVIILFFLSFKKEQEESKA